MRILFVIKALGNSGGGAERVLTGVASGLSLRGHHITILTSDPSAATPYYHLAESTHLVTLGIGNAAGKSGVIDLVRRVVSYRRSIRMLRPDVVVAFMHSSYIPAGLSLIGSRVPLVASEHIGPEHYATRPVERVLINLAPLLSSRITVVSEQIRLSFSRWISRKMVVIPNPVVVQPCQEKRQDRQGDKVLLSVGRLAPQKDQHLLVAAFGAIAHEFPKWRLRLVGDGELRSSLETQIEKLGIGAQVELPGAVSDVDAEYVNADLFVLPSSYESFGLATAEALLHGLPAVGFADCAGTNELIRDGENGKLVFGEDRVVALAAGLGELMGNERERIRLSESSRAHIKSQYGLESVLDQWELLLHSARS